jgi:hypothetical protein
MPAKIPAGVSAQYQYDCPAILCFSAGSLGVAFQHTGAKRSKLEIVSSSILPPHLEGDGSLQNQTAFPLFKEPSEIIPAFLLVRRPPRKYFRGGTIKWQLKQASRRQYDGRDQTVGLGADLAEIEKGNLRVNSMIYVITKPCPVCKQQLTSQGLRP